MSLSFLFFIALHKIKVSISYCFVLKSRKLTTILLKYIILDKKPKNLLKLFIYGTKCVIFYKNVKIA